MSNKKNKALPDIRLRRSRWQAGFTLIEAIVALSILTTAIFACLQVLFLGLKLAKSAKQKTIDVLSSQAQIEEMLTKSYQEIQGEEVLPGLKKIEVNNLKTYVAD